MPDTQQRPGRKPGQQEPKPWRVEGHPDHEREQQPKPPMLRFWWLVIALFALNFVLSFALSGKPARTSIPYSLFYKQVQQGNVSEISSKGEETQGDFKKVVRYP